MMRACLIVLFMITIASSASSRTGETQGQYLRQRDVKWIGLPPGDSLLLDSAKVAETIDPATLTRTDFIQRAGDKKPIPFYTHWRSIDITLAHSHRFLLINDHLASKDCRVMVADLDARRDWQIDLSADEIYRRNVSPNDRLIIRPEGYAFSPDDNEVLIGMDLFYVSAHTAQEARQFAKLYKRWWYVVATDSGHVLRAYQNSDIPKRWCKDSGRR